MVINEDNAIPIMISSRHRADIDTGSILTLVAGSGLKIGATTGEAYFIDLNPLLSLRNKMPGGGYLS